MKQVKICGLSRKEDIEAVNRIAPEYCGFVINFPKSIRSVSPETVKKLTMGLSHEIIPVGVFVNQPPEFAARLLNEGVISAAQLHGDEDEDYISALRRLTDKPVWKAFKIRTALDVKAAENSSADFVLLDSGQGSGRTFDWSFTEDISRPFGLAGGLSTENLDSALKTGAVLLDVSGGVETNGVKDAEKIRRFVDRIRTDR